MGRAQTLSNSLAGPVRVLVHTSPGRGALFPEGPFPERGRACERRLAGGLDSFSVESVDAIVQRAPALCKVEACSISSPMELFPERRMEQPERLQLDSHAASAGPLRKKEAHASLRNARKNERPEEPTKTTAFSQTTFVLFHVQRRSLFRHVQAVVRAGLRARRARVIARFLKRNFRGG